MSFPPSQLAEKHHFDKKSDFASKFMKSRDYGVTPISGKSSCGMFLSAVRSTYSGCAQTSKYQVLGLDEFQSVISVKPIKEQRRSSFKDVFHGSSIFSGIACIFTRRCWLQKYMILPNKMYGNIYLEAYLCNKINLEKRLLTWKAIFTWKNQY